MSLRYLLVCNPTAQSGRAARRVEEAVRAMGRRGMALELCETEPARATIQKVRARLERGGIDVVVALGGDGTFHEVATAILEAQVPVPLGMLPSGTANDQGKSFGIRRGDTERNLEVIAAGHLTELDVGRIARMNHHGEVLDETLFFDSCGWGMQSDILALRNRQREVVSELPLVREIFRDEAVYFSASMAKLVESYVNPVKFRADVIANGKLHVFEGLTDLVISATPIYAGHWVLDRNAAADDGLFELVPFQGRRDWASKALRDLAVSPVWQEELDLLGLEHSQGFRAQSFDIDLFRPEKVDLNAQVDGDEWHGGDRYRVEVSPDRLPLLTPRDFVPPWRPRA
ncbi:MAG: hypothetical protein EXR75_15350 [Myxococcales bacterium]|nr:hypothetical protein [Myxococcales bacterium]